MIINNTLFYLILFACTLTIILLYHRKQYQMYRITLSYYLIAILGSIVYYYMLTFVIQKEHDYRNIELVPLLFLLCNILILCYPFKILDKKPINKIESRGLSIIFERTAIFLGVVSIIPFITDLIQLSSFNISSFADSYENTERNKDLIYYFSQLKYYLYFWQIPLFFYLISTPRRNKLALIAIIFCIMSTILHSLVGGGRGTLVNYCNYIVFFYFIYKEHLEVTIKRILNKVILTAGFLLITSLSIITWSRYSTFETESSVKDGLVTWVSLYIGEGPLAFSGQMWDSKVRTKGDNSFSLAKSILGLRTFKSNAERREYWERLQDIPNTIFYTIIGDIYSDLGKAYTIIFFIVFTIIVTRFIKKRQKRGWRVQDLVLLQIYYELVTMGIMNFCFKNYDPQFLICFTIIQVLIVNNIQKKHIKQLHNGNTSISYRNSSL